MTTLRDLSPQQWKSGIAAWLGWLFDGLDMHLYSIVAMPLVVQLLHATGPKDRDVGFYSSLIQAAFLAGWALGGGFFGRLGDRLGRARALMLTILTYASFTGLGFFAQTWWQLLSSVSWPRWASAANGRSARPCSPRPGPRPGGPGSPPRCKPA